MANDTEYQGISPALRQLANVVEKVRAEPSPQEAMEIDASKVTRQFFCAWDYRFNVANQLIGYPFRSTLGSTNHKLFRQLPDAYWEFVNTTPEGWLKPFLFAKSCTIKPVGKCLPVVSSPGITIIPAARYTVALLTVEYTTRPYVVEKCVNLKNEDSPPTEDLREFRRFVTEEYHPVGEAIMVEGGFMKFAEGPLKGKAFPAAVSKILPKAKIKWTWHQVPRLCVPFDTINNAIGKINAGQFNGRYGRSFEEGTLLLEDVEYVPHVSPVGDYCFDIVYNTLFNPKKHYKVFWKGRETGNLDFGFYEVTTTGAPATSAAVGVRLYDTVDWETLFTPI